MRYDRRMPNFDLTIVSGTTSRGWDDPRLNHRGLAQHLYRRVEPPNELDYTEVVIHAVVDGVDAPLDVALGGDLFFTSRVSWSGTFPFAIIPTAGHSSLIKLRFAHHMLGHQELQVRRANGGAITLSFEVEQ